MSDNHDENKLIERMCRGEEAAFSEAIREYSPAMRRTASAIAGHDNADDILQECWISVVRNIHGFRRQSSLRTWLISIVANRARSHLRSAGREAARRAQPAKDQDVSELFDRSGHWRKPVSDWGSDMPEGMLESEALRDCLAMHMDKLPPRQREALVLREMEDLSHDEVCRIMDISNANARVLLHRARLALFGMVDHFRETGEC
jgi:RNA polymerase sigma-70 factor (ECF subfamily)